jgi:hypothetical protein
MNPSDRPTLSIAAEAEIEARKRIIHLEYEPLFQQLQELTDEARADYRLLNRPKRFDPAPPKSPHNLRRLLANYASRLFALESNFFPSAQYSRNWLENLSERIIREILGRIKEIEEAGKFRYVTLKYHGVDLQGMVSAMREGIKEILDELAREAEQEDYCEATQHLMVEPESEPAQPAPEPQTPSAARRKFVDPILDEKGWSALDWANEAGVAYHTASDYLAGTTNPFRSTRVKLSRALGVAVKDLP